MLEVQYNIKLCQNFSKYPLDINATLTSNKIVKPTITNRQQHKIKNLQFLMLEQISVRS